MEAVPNPYYSALPPGKSASGAALPRPSKLVFVSISQDPAGYLTALQAPGVAIDKAEDFQPGDVTTLSRIKGYNVFVGPNLTIEHLELNTASRYLSDVRVRQALALAIDKTALLHNLFPAFSSKQIAGIKADSLYPGNSPWVDKSISSPYDLAQAQKLLTSAGYCGSAVTNSNSNCKRIVLSFDTTQNTTRLKAGSILKRDWAQIGVILNINPPKPSFGVGGLFADYSKNGVLNTRHFDVALFAWSASPSPDWSAELLPKYIPTAAVHSGTQNYAGINDPVITSASVSGLKTLDTATRYKIYDQLQKEMATKAYWIPLYTRANITVDNGTIVNYTPNPTQAGNEWNAFQWSKKAAQ